MMPLDTTIIHAAQRAEPDFTSNQQRSWDIGQQRVICGDCLTKLQNLPDSGVDVVVTSPPYNIGMSYRTYDDNKPRSNYLAWLADVGRQLHRVLKDDGSL